MSNPARRPYLGEDIHFQSHPSPDRLSRCRAAKVIDTCDGTGVCSLIVFDFNGTTPFHDLAHDEIRRPPGTWHFAH